MAPVQSAGTLHGVLQAGISVGVGVRVAVGAPVAVGVGVLVAVGAPVGVGVLVAVGVAVGPVPHVPDVVHTGHEKSHWDEVVHGPPQGTFVGVGVRVGDGVGEFVGVAVGAALQQIMPEPQALFVGVDPYGVSPVGQEEPERHQFLVPGLSVG